MTTCRTSRYEQTLGQLAVKLSALEAASAPVVTFDGTLENCVAELRTLQQSVDSSSADPLSGLLYPLFTQIYLRLVSSREYTLAADLLKDLAALEKTTRHKTLLSVIRTAVNPSGLLAHSIVKEHLNSRFKLELEDAQVRRLSDLLASNNLASLTHLISQCIHFTSASLHSAEVSRLQPPGEDMSELTRLAELEAALPELPVNVQVLSTPNPSSPEWRAISATLSQGRLYCGAGTGLFTCRVNDFGEAGANSIKRLVGTTRSVFSLHTSGDLLLADDALFQITESAVPTGNVCDDLTPGRTALRQPRESCCELVTRYSNALTTVWAARLTEPQLYLVLAEIRQLFTSTH